MTPQIRHSVFTKKLFNPQAKTAVFLFQEGNLLLMWALKSVEWSVLYFKCKVEIQN